MHVGRSGKTAEEEGSRAKEREREGERRSKYYNKYEHELAGEVVGEKGKAQGRVESRPCNTCLRHVACCRRRGATDAAAAFGIGCALIAR